tara:strand:+ start:281 stop:583 length:303 start_codon:yes stop_codon:yes gene_type:complete
MPYLIHREAETLPTQHLKIMDWHNQSLNWFESFERFQDKLEADNLLKLQQSESSSRYYVEASLNGVYEWSEWAYDEHELDLLKQDAKDCGYSYTVEEVKQ